MDAKTLRSKTEQGLQKELQDAKEHLKQLSFKVASNQLRNVRDIRKTRKTIARIETILKQTANEAASKEK